MRAIASQAALPAWARKVGRMASGPEAVLENWVVLCRLTSSAVDVRACLGVRRDGGGGGVASMLHLWWIAS